MIKSSLLKGWGAALFTAFVWGASPVACMPLLAVADSKTIVWMQYSIATISLFFIINIMPKADSDRQYPKLTLSWHNRHDLFWSAMCGFVGLGMFNYLSFRSLEWISASENGVIQGLLPILILTVGFLRYHARFSSAQIISALTAFIGVMILVKQGKPGTNAFNQGHLLSLVSIICFASHAYMRVTLANKYGTIQTLYHQLGFSSLGLSIWGMISGIQMTTVWSILITPEFCLSICFMGIGIACISYLIYLYAIHNIGVDNAGIALNAIPLSSFFLSFWLLNEPFSSTRLLAIAIVISSMITFTRYQNKQHEYHIATV